MPNKDIIPKDEQKGVMEAYWTMLRTIEGEAHNKNDPILKLWVEQWYQKYNRIMGTNITAVWKDKR